jgi:hypothetical protein
MSRFCAVALLLALTLVGAPCVRGDDKPEPKPAKDEVVRTVVYDVSELIHRPGGRTGYDNIDEIAREIVTSVQPGRWGGETEGENRLTELNGTKLEIRTKAKYHAEIADQLAALRRMMDMAVNLRVDLFAVDRDLFEKVIKPKFGARPVAEGDALDLLHKKRSLVVTNAVSGASRKELQPLSVRQVFTFVENARPGEKRQVDEYGSGFQGLSVRVTPTVSPDRRFVTLKVVQQATELIELKKQTRLTFADTELREVIVEVPHLSETTTTTTIEVGDGGSAMALVTYRTPAAKAKDRVLVLVLRPEIYIAEEDKARTGNNPK